MVWVVTPREKLVVLLNHINENGRRGQGLGVEAALGVHPRLCGGWLGLERKKAQVGMSVVRGISLCMHNEMHMGEILENLLYIIYYTNE